MTNLEQPIAISANELATVTGGEIIAGTIKRGERTGEAWDGSLMSYYTVHAIPDAHHRGGRLAWAHV